MVVTTANGCTNTTTAQIGQSTSEANVSVAGGELTCNSDNLQLQVSSSAANLTYNWTGPNGFTSEEKNPIVSVAGIYVLEAVAANGCASTATAIVSANTNAPNVQIEGGVIDCDESTTTLSATSSDVVTAFMWEGPNGFSSDQSVITVTTAGNYSLRVYNANGCFSSLTHPVIADTAAPSFSIFAEDLSCESPSARFQLNTANALSTYQWIGPENFQSTEANPVITKAGTYTLTATSSTGCAASQTYTVASNTLAPSLRIQAAGTIDCNNTSTRLQVNSTTALTKYQWTGPNGFLSHEASPTVSLAGTYSLSATASNGCPTVQSYTCLLYTSPSPRD